MVKLFAIRHIFVPNIPEICLSAQLFIVLRRLSDKVLGVNARLTLMGGDRYTPVPEGVTFEDIAYRVEF